MQNQGVGQLSSMGKPATGKRMWAIRALLGNMLLLPLVPVGVRYRACMWLCNYAPYLSETHRWEELKQHSSCTCGSWRVVGADAV